jgi:hypothetical protein
MSRTWKAALTLGVFLAALGAVAAAEEKKPAKPIVKSDKITMKATILEIDKTNRLLTVKGEKGEETTFYVDEAVQRFDALKVGDKITATYYESVAFELKKPGEVVPEESQAAIAGVTPGAKPGGVAGTQEVMTVTVQAVDMNTPSITVTKSDGTVVTRRVKNKSHLKNVQVGDTIVITKTEALAIDVKEAK